MTSNYHTRRTSSCLLSVVVLQWDRLHHTDSCVQSVRAHTDVSYELIIVDNGSRERAADYARRTADRSVINPNNRGFAAGMNQGLSIAAGEYVAFLNNDTVLPASWASALIDTLESSPTTALVVPAVTAAGSELTVRTSPGTSSCALPPFRAVPSAVLYLARTATVRMLEGWDESYLLASYEDLDLCFKIWTNDLDIVLDERVLVQHTSKGTAAVKLPNHRAQWERNQRRFIEKWTDPSLHVPYLNDCNVRIFERNRSAAQSVAHWMGRYVALRDRLLKRRVRRVLVGLRSRGRRLASTLLIENTRSALHEPTASITRTMRRRN